MNRRTFFRLLGGAVAPVLLPWLCGLCGATGRAMHYAVVGEAFQWADVAEIDIDEGETWTTA